MSSQSDVDKLIRDVETSPMADAGEQAYWIARASLEVARQLAISNDMAASQLAKFDTP